MSPCLVERGGMEHRRGHQAIALQRAVRRQEWVGLPGRQAQKPPGLAVKGLEFRAGDRPAAAA